MLCGYIIYALFTIELSNVIVQIRSSFQSDVSVASKARAKKSDP